MMPQLATKLTEQFPKWLSAGRVSGNVLMEVMQNDQARMLIAGKRQSTGLALYESFSKGGWVMIPMLMLPFWVLYLMIGQNHAVFRTRPLVEKAIRSSNEIF